MANNIKARPMDAIVQEFASKGFGPATIRFMQDLAERNDKTLTNLGLLTTQAQIPSADQIAADGVTFGRVKGTALTANQVDLTKAGVIGPLGSAKINQNVMFNYSNNATVDSIDNGTNATVRVYGPGGVGTTWHQFIGSVIGPEQPAFSGTAAYATSVFVVFNGSTFSITTAGKDILPDGIRFCAAIKTVAAGGGGGTSGGGGTNGGAGGRLENSVA